FRGYRGFGVCRDLAQIDGLAQINGLAQIKGSAQSAPGEAAPAGAPLRPPAPHDRAITAAPDQAAPDGGPGSAVVVPFRPAAAAEPKPAPTLTPIERRAFRELALELTSRLRGAQAAATAEAVAQELGQELRQDQTLSQDELRQVLSQALNQETGEEFGEEPSLELSQEASHEQSQEGEQNAAKNNAEQPDTEASEESRTESEEPSQSASKPARDAVNEQTLDAPGALADQLLAPAFLDRIPVGILVYRYDGLLYANRYFFDLSGYSDVAAIESAGGLNRLFAEPDGSTTFADSAGAQTLESTPQPGGGRRGEGRRFTVPGPAPPAIALILKKTRS